MMGRRGYFPVRVVTQGTFGELRRWVATGERGAGR
jgi:hypothetical protein